MAPNHLDNPQDLTPDQLPTIKVTKRLDRSTLTLIAQTCIRPFNSRLITPKEKYPAGSPQLEVHKRAKNKIDASERKVSDIYVYDILPKKPCAISVAEPEKKRAKRIYYFAGGGWQMPPSGEHWCLVAEMAAKLPDTAVSLVSYPLAPDSPAPVAFPMLMKLYRTVMKEAADAGEDVILAGDSAGGNIVLSIIVTALLEDADSNITPEPPCPKAILVISPSTDLRRGNADMKHLERKDPLLRFHAVSDTARSWRSDWDPRDIRVSPLYADLTPLAKRGVKVHGITGRYDILSPDAVLFREKCNQSWVQGEWLDWEKQMHCFPLAFSFKLRESVEAKDWILDLLRRS